MTATTEQTRPADQAGTRRSAGSAAAATVGGLAG